MAVVDSDEISFGIEAGSPVSPRGVFIGIARKPASGSRRGFGLLDERFCDGHGTLGDTHDLILLYGDLDLCETGLGRRREGHDLPIVAVQRSCAIGDRPFICEFGIYLAPPAVPADSAKWPGAFYCDNG